MGKRIIVYSEDDLTGERSEDVASHELCLDGITYEIDLTSANFAGLKEILAPYISAGRRAGQSRQRRKPQDRGSKTSPAVVRAWAAQEGLNVNPRGRVSRQVYEAFADAHA